MPNYPKSFILIDPDYQDEKTYHKHYDYDLLGHPIGLTQDLLRNPVSFLQNSVQSYQVEVMISLFLFGGFLIFLAVFKIFLLKLANMAKLTLKIALQLLKARSTFKKHTKAGLGKNYDIYAQAAFRIFSLVHGIYSSKKKPVPESATDYEALRFVMADPWVSAYVTRALDSVDLTVPVDDEAIEGLAEDEKHGYLDIEEEDEEEEELEDLGQVGDISSVSDGSEDSDKEEELNAEGDVDSNQFYYDDDEEEQTYEQDQNVTGMNRSNLSGQNYQFKEKLDEISTSLLKFRKSTDDRERNFANRFSLYVPSTSTSEDDDGIRKPEV